MQFAKPQISPFNTYKTEIFLLAAGLSSLYVLLSLFGIDVLIAFTISAVSLLAYVYQKVNQYREGGLINRMSEKTRKALTEKSLLDIYRDLIYFPRITKIIGAFLKGAVSKPPPEKIHDLFQDLPESVKKTINTKGLLHLAPSKVEQMFLEVPENGQEISEERINKEILDSLPKNYGKVDQAWYNEDKYHQAEAKVHEHTIMKNISHTINEKVAWKHLLGLGALLLFFLMKTKSKKMGKIFLYNGTFVGILLLVILLLAKTSKPLKKYRIEE